MLHLCNINFFSQYGYINGNSIHVNEYIKHNNKNNVTCQKGHDLILVNGEKRKPHFRHKHSVDTGGNPMTTWHTEWQSHFPITEQCFPSKPTQIKERRADIVLNNKKTLEIQHSEYDRKEIDNRKHDYQLHGIDIYWLIDGNTSIYVKELEYSNRVYIEFTSEYWKYESFKSYDFIFIDIKSNIYKIYPNKVKSHMIDVEKPKSKEEFIEALKNDVDIWKNEEPEQCNLFIKQQGAGNGKTFGIIKMLEDDDKCHYTKFIYITKQHSAKHIIKTEFETQQQNLTYLKDIEIKETNKKYIIKYFNEKSKMNCQIIISTIDAFTYSIGNKNHSYYDKFPGIIYSIIDGHIESKNCGTINFSGINPKLNKETLLVIDEFQDPPEYYAKAIVEIMRNKYIDVFIVGDKLQSISNEKNAFTYFLEHEFPSINVVKLQPTNVCRRFIHPKLIDFVNYMIPFEKYSLPPIVGHKEYVDIDKNYEPLTFFKSEKRINVLGHNDVNEENISIEVEKIMNYYEKEVEIYDRFPNNFLIVTPFTTKNPLVEALLLAINIYWKKKCTDNPEFIQHWKDYIKSYKNDVEFNVTMDDYYRYAIFHKSEDGSSIDLSESEYATRIVSCHSSKGDGREVVFIIGFTESALKIFSQKSNNLVYDSLVHVAITRMKVKLYIRYEDNNDDIVKKINKYVFNNVETICEDVKPNITIDNRIKYNEIANYAANTHFELFNENIINKISLEKINENLDEKRVVDMGNHCIRYSSLKINILLEIINKEIKENTLDIKKQIKKIMDNVCKSDVIPTNDMKGYYTLLKGKDIIPIIKMSIKGRDYIKYFTIIDEFIKKIQEKIKDLIKQKVQITLCPLECIMLHYMIQITDQKQFSDINIVEVYDIIDIYNNSFDENNIGHDNCLCKKHFNKNKVREEGTSKKIDSMKIYLGKHFEKIKDIKNIMSLFHLRYPKVNWLINHPVKHEGNNSFSVTQKFTLIGYNESNVIICYIKPQFNSLNYNEIIMNSIFDTHLINNVKKYDKNEITDNYKRFNGKKVTTCIFTLDRNEPYYIDWSNYIKDNKEMINTMICSYMIEKYNSETSSIFYFYSYWRKYCPDNEKKPSDFIRFLREKAKEQPVEYMDNFFSHIDYEIYNSKGKTNKEKVFKKYDDKEYFYEKLEHTLEVSIKRYLGIQINDDDDYDDDDSDNN